MRKSLITCLFIFTFISLTSQVSGLSGAISPPKIDIMVNTTDGLPQDVNSIIYVKNPNNYPVKVELTPTGDLNNSDDVIVKLQKNNFTLNPNETVKINISFNVKRHGKFEGSILTRISPLTYNTSNRSVMLKASVVLPTDVVIMSYGNEFPIKEIIIALFLAIGIFGTTAVILRKM